MKMLIFQDLLHNLEESVQKHSQWKAECDAYHDWLNSEKEKLEECDNTTGEKVTLSQRMGVIQKLKEKISVGEQKISGLEALSQSVVKSTSKKGIDTIEKELKEIKASLRSYLEQLGEF